LAETVRKSFNTLTNENPMEYLDIIYTAYEKRAEQGDDDIEVLERPWEIICHLRERLAGYLGDILQEVGIGEVWNSVNDLAKPIVFVVELLVDLDEEDEREGEEEGRMFEVVCRYHLSYISR
jgi:hypothetical protein